jgi:hypothetical protein
MTTTRKLENLHILLWLLKDISWLMFWKPLGIFMIIPTLICAIIISWKSRTTRSELFHNLAITFWIIANSYWMLTEFLKIDEEFRIFAIIPFVIGLMFIAAYYLLVARVTILRRR